MNTLGHNMKREPDSAAPSREESLFDAALALPPEQRAAYLDKECGPDAALRQRVADLLKAYGKSDGFLEAPAAAAGPSGTMAADCSARRKSGRRHRAL